MSWILFFLDVKDAAVLNDLLELRRRFHALARQKIGLSAKIDEKHHPQLKRLGLVLGPLLEESFFRGCLLPALAQTTGTIPAVIITGAARTQEFDDKHEEEAADEVEGPYHKAVPPRLFGSPLAALCRDFGVQPLGLDMLKVVSPALTG